MGLLEKADQLKTGEVAPVTPQRSNSMPKLSLARRLHPKQPMPYPPNQLM